MFHLSRQEVELLIATARKHDECAADLFEALWYHAHRISEVLALTPSNLQGGLLVVQRLKGSKLTRQRPVASLLARAAHTPKGARIFVLCAPGSDAKTLNSERRQADRLVKRFGLEAGLPPHLLRTHIFRHSAAHFLLDEGASLPTVQRRLGHKSLASTGQYLVVDDQQADEAFSKALTKRKDSTR
jgi:integrase